MYIKQVIIEGFKSYKDQTIAEPFSSKINVVVGANGSGKSNFFDAIRFVLNDSTVAMRAEERQKLLHEGAGHAVLSAYVEIVFDNADNRLPVDREEVRLRRTIGLKKDEFTMDRKHITKSELTSLLESAGFSRANPYYIVQQGKISALSMMKDEQRLALLKEVGGTKVYEERRRESLKMMAETEGRQLRIQEVVEHLNAKLAELEGERAELVEYQRLDKQRRALEFAIYDRDLSDTKAALEKVEAERQEEGARAGEVHRAKREAHAALKKVDKELRALLAELPVREAARQEAAAEKLAAVRRRAKAELDVKELHERMRANTAAKGSRQTELKSLEAQIAGAEAEAVQVEAQLAQHREQEAALEKETAQKDRRLQALYQKQGRTAQFASVSERDKWLNAEIAKLAEAQRRSGDTRRTLQAVVTTLNSELMEVSQSIGDMEASVKARTESSARCEREASEMKARRDQLQNDRKELWREESTIKERQKGLTEELRRLSAHLEKAVGRDVDRALSSIRNLVREHNIEGVHGPFIELFKCMEQMHAAVEVTAGNQLFHVVVENDDVATTLVNHLNRTKGGRATFMPLNRLQSAPVTYPKEFGEDAVSMIKHLKFDKHFEKAMQQVFGKVMVCKNLDVATAVSRSSGLNCVTMDGDQRDKKGTLTGGFIDASRSRLTAMAAIKDMERKSRAAGAELLKHAAQLAEVEQAVTLVMGEMERLTAKRGHLRDGTNALKAELRTVQLREEELRKQLEAKERALEEAQTTAESLESQVAGLRAEVGTQLLGSLSPEERREMPTLNPELERLQKETTAVRLARMEVETKLQGLQETLRADLGRGRQELQDALAAAEADVDKSTLDARQAEAAGAGAAVDEAAGREKGAAAAADTVAAQIAAVQKEQEQLRADESEGQLQTEAEASTMESLLMKRGDLQSKKADTERRIRELGSLPGDAFEKFRDADLMELDRQRLRTNSQLKKYSHVNKKALDQFTDFTEKREELAARHAENQAAERKIRDLIATLDLRKDEAVERTFKGVAKNFREVFRDLAPGGRGELVMQKRLRRPPKEGGFVRAEGLDAEAEPDEEEGEEEEEESTGISEKYSGVKVRVSFGAGEVMSMKQLSGGQKTLVALALIFAIQRCDPAAFYLFDEIDAALDPQYRTTVARMLAQQAADERNPSQFIVTTFHPQIIQQADKVYGVSHKNRISQVDVVSQEDALTFVQAADQPNGDAA